VLHDAVCGSSHDTAFSRVLVVLLSLGEVLSFTSIQGILAGEAIRGPRHRLQPLRTNLLIASCCGRARWGISPTAGWCGKRYRADRLRRLPHPRSEAIVTIIKLSSRQRFSSMYLFVSEMSLLRLLGIQQGPVVGREYLL